ncbi:hypothetical protein K3N28_17030 [Glycomyces sp. TRM65418]|uniref:hypothetical protein n=1 Tax=Glycomyces sp. TRM65418 TaxID=2867006 RepID=UPI001CE68B0E|nr:hypothetical protein [Glycomyces sp. TRM65418]MCC3764763.1 hypothetical protein [Glycomyces sp. TRM65418]QZD54417.1 hypothetical protein K3N28_16945 [Glycomyces sp. TRM65418]
MLCGAKQIAAPAADGNPAKAAAAILEALAADPVPLRLALGDTAVDAISADLKAPTEELAAWEHVSRAMNFDD